LQSLTINSFILYRQTKINNTNYLDETTIPMDLILYLSLYYLVNDLVHLPNLTITNQVEMWPHPKNDATTNPLDLYPSSRVTYPQNAHPSSEAG